MIGTWMFAEEHRVLRLFIKDGFDSGDKAFHIVDPELRGEHLKQLNTGKPVKCSEAIQPRSRSGVMMELAPGAKKSSDRGNWVFHPNNSNLPSLTAAGMPGD